jgi:hypothetical protein
MHNKNNISRKTKMSYNLKNEGSSKHPELADLKHIQEEKVKFYRQSSRYMIQKE